MLGSIFVYTGFVKMWTRDNYLIRVQISMDSMHKNTRLKPVPNFQCEETYNPTNTFYYIFPTKMSHIQILPPNYIFNYHHTHSN